MSKPVEIELQTMRSEADTSGMLTEMAKRLYIRRFSDHNAESDAEIENAGPRKPDTRSRKEKDGS